MTGTGGSGTPTQGSGRRKPHADPGESHTRHTNITLEAGRRKKRGRREKGEGWEKEGERESRGDYAGAGIKKHRDGMARCERTDPALTVEC